MRSIVAAERSSTVMMGASTSLLAFGSPMRPLRYLKTAMVLGCCSRASRSRLAFFAFGKPVMEQSVSRSLMKQRNLPRAMSSMPL
jgi:hypothetical protein